MASQHDLGSGDHSSLFEKKVSTFQKVADVINGHFGDNFATSEMVEFFQEQFENMDFDGDGKLTKEDVASLYQHRGEQLQDTDLFSDEEVIEDIFNEMDYNDDGDVTFLDFAIFMTLQMKRRSRSNKGDFHGAFEVADRNGDGLVTREDLCMGINGAIIMELQDADGIIDQYDQEGKGMLSRDEYCKFMCDQGKKSVDFFCNPESRPATANGRPLSARLSKSRPGTSQGFECKLSPNSRPQSSRMTADAVQMNCSTQTSTEVSSQTPVVDVDSKSSGTEQPSALPFPKPLAACIRIHELINDEDFLSPCRELFQSLDADRDGNITKRDIQNWLQSLNDDLTPDDINLRFRELNRSQTGYANLKEFLVWSALNQFEFEFSSKEKRYDLFKLFDLDGDGFLNKEELGVSDKLLPVISDQNKDEILAKYDQDGDGKLSYEEFSVMVRDYMKKSIF